MDYKKIQPVIELYRAIQTEGSKAGIPHIILRTTGCTHRCFFGEGGWCDSWYTSIHPEKGKYTLDDIRDFFISNKDITHLMLTGGSPSMHPQLCNEIINIFKELHGIWESNDTWLEDGGSIRRVEGVRKFVPGGVVTMETEGSHALKTDLPIDLISLSPKFSNSVPVLGSVTPMGKIVDEKFIKQHNKFRLNLDVIKELISNHKDYHFKPVCNPVEQPEIWEEIQNFMKRMDIPKSKTWIMPPGDDRKELLRVYPMVLDFCTENAYNFSGREHILAYGDKREV